MTTSTSTFATPARTASPDALIEAAEQVTTESQGAAIHDLTVSLFDRARRFNAGPRKFGVCRLLPAYGGADDLWSAAEQDATLRIMYGVSLSYFRPA